MQLSEIDTPALVVDLDVVEGNIRRMADFFAERDADLRPHFKTPKCAEIVQMQLEAGAIGITCAKLGEVEALAAAGVSTSVLIANQIVGSIKVERLVATASSMQELIVAVDTADQVDAMDRVLRDTTVTLGAVIEVEVGMERCGTATPAKTVALARHIDRSRVEYRGIMGFEGHAVLVPDRSDRYKVTEQAISSLMEHRLALVDAGLEPEIVSSGGTGTFDMTAGFEGITEIQAGSYVFMDGAYREIRTDFNTALTLHTTVIHRSGRRIIADCGLKSLSNDLGPSYAPDLPVRCELLSEEHGHIVIDNGADVDLVPGDRLRLVPSHCDTTINLHEIYYSVRRDEVVDTWNIIGRGKFV